MINEKEAGLTANQQWIRDLLKKIANHCSFTLATYGGERVNLLKCQHHQREVLQEVLSLLTIDILMEIEDSDCTCKVIFLLGDQENSVREEGISMKLSTPSPIGLVTQRIETLKEKQQTFNAEFQKLWNQEASFENRARVMELLGGNREVGAEMEFLESLKVGLS